MIKDLSRRDFLKLAGGALVAAAGAKYIPTLQSEGGKADILTQVIGDTVAACRERLTTLNFPVALISDPAETPIPDYSYIYPQAAELAAELGHIPVDIGKHLSARLAVSQHELDAHYTGYHDPGAFVARFDDSSGPGLETDAAPVTGPLLSKLGVMRHEYHGVALYPPFAKGILSLTGPVFAMPNGEMFATAQIAGIGPTGENTYPLVARFPNDLTDDIQLHQHLSGKLVVVPDRFGATIITQAGSSVLINHINNAIGESSSQRQLSLSDFTGVDASRFQSLSPHGAQPSTDGTPGLTAGLATLEDRAGRLRTFTYVKSDDGIVTEPLAFSETEDTRILGKLGDYTLVGVKSGDILTGIRLVSLRDGKFDYNNLQVNFQLPDGSQFSDLRTDYAAGAINFYTGLDLIGTADLGDDLANHVTDCVRSFSTAPDKLRETDTITAGLPLVTDEKWELAGDNERVEIPRNSVFVFVPGEELVNTNNIDDLINFEEPHLRSWMRIKYAGASDALYNEFQNRVAAAGSLTEKFRIMREYDVLVVPYVVAPGANDVDSKGVTLLGMAMQTASMIKAVDARNLVILGHSKGANVVQMFMKMYQEGWIDGLMGGARVHLAWIHGRTLPTDEVIGKYAGEFSAILEEMEQKGELGLANRLFGGVMRTGAYLAEKTNHLDAADRMSYVAENTQLLNILRGMEPLLVGIDKGKLKNKGATVIESFGRDDFVHFAHSLASRGIGQAEPHRFHTTLVSGTQDFTNIESLPDLPESHGHIPDILQALVRIQPADPLANQSVSALETLGQRTFREIVDRFSTQDMKNPAIVAQFVDVLINKYIAISRTPLDRVLFRDTDIRLDALSQYPAVRPGYAVWAQAWKHFVNIDRTWVDKNTPGVSVRMLDNSNIQEVHDQEGFVEWHQYLGFGIVDASFRWVNFRFEESTTQVMSHLLMTQTAAEEQLTSPDQLMLADNIRQGAGTGPLYRLFTEILKLPIPHLLRLHRQSKHEELAVYIGEQFSEDILQANGYWDQYGLNENDRLRELIATYPQFLKYFKGHVVMKSIAEHHAGNFDQWANCLKYLRNNP